MGRITARIKLNQFYIRKQNDKGGKDEPYLLTLFARLDGTMADPQVPIDQRVLPIHIPDALGHGDLGPDSKEMSLTGRNIVKVPTAIGQWESTLTSEHLDAIPGMMRNCAFGIGVVFLEEDSTLDSTVRAFLPEAKKEIHKRANIFIRFILGWEPELPAFIPGREQILSALRTYRAQLLQSDINPNGVINGEALMDHVLGAILPGEIGKAIGKILVPVGELGNIIGAIVQGTDPDEFIGANGRTFAFYDLVGRAHAPLKFEFDTVTTMELRLPFTTEGIQIPLTAKGIYAVDGTVRRTDADEPPTVAALRGPGQKVTVLGRRLNEDSFQRNNSDDFGQTYKVDSSGGTFEAGRFRSGPAAANSADGNTQLVAGLGLDNEIWFAFSENAGATWIGWKKISRSKAFKGAPAVTLSLSGKTIYVVGRDDDDFYWFTKSSDRGATWDQWQRIGGGIFHSSPSMVLVKKRSAPGQSNPNVLVVAGLGTDNRVWTTRFADSASLAGQDWHPIRAGAKDHPTRAFTSAPAMTSGIHEDILLVCRADDLLFWYVQSLDGGEEFAAGTVWQRFGRPDKGAVGYNDKNERRGDLQDMYSAPAVVASNDLEQRLILGLSPTLGFWRNQCSRHEEEIWRPITQEPEPGFRMHYY